MKILSLLSLIFLSTVLGAPGQIASKIKSNQIDKTRQNMIEKIQSLRFNERITLLTIDRRIRQATTAPAVLEQKRQDFIAQNDAKIQAAFDKLVRWDIANSGGLISPDTIALQFEIFGPNSPPSFQGSGGRFRELPIGALEGEEKTDMPMAGVEHQHFRNDPTLQPEDNSFDASSQQSILEHTNQHPGVSAGLEHPSGVWSEHVPLTAHE